jgi:hypothetical protein
MLIKSLHKFHLKFGQLYLSVCQPCGIGIRFKHFRKLLHPLLGHPTFDDSSPPSKVLKYILSRYRSRMDYIYLTYRDVFQIIRRSGCKKPDPNYILAGLYKYLLFIDMFCAANTRWRLRKTRVKEYRHSLPGEAMWMYRVRHKSVNTPWGISRLITLEAPGSQYIVVGGKAARNARCVRQAVRGIKGC